MAGAAELSVSEMGGASYVPAKTDLAAAWMRCRHWLLPALVQCRGTYAEDDILRGILTAQYLLFEGRASAAVTYVEQFPARKVLHVFLAGGDLMELQAMECDVAAHAKAAGISRMEISGRRGWLRSVPGYQELCATFIKDL